MKRSRREIENKAKLAAILTYHVVAGDVMAKDVKPGPVKTVNGATFTVSVEGSDVINFHIYSNLADTRKAVEALKKYGRPLICTEYMARPTGSTFHDILPYFKEQKIAAINWGFVDGKSQTKFAWDSWDKPYPAEPELWFHDVLRGDGSPYRKDEVELIRRLTGKAK